MNFGVPTHFLLFFITFWSWKNSTDNFRNGKRYQYNNEWRIKIRINQSYFFRNLIFYIIILFFISLKINYKYKFNKLEKNTFILSIYYYLRCGSDGRRSYTFALKCMHYISIAMLYISKKKIIKMQP